MPPGTDTTVVVVTYNSASTIERCLGSVLRSDPCDIVVVDNASADDTVARVRALDDSGRIRVVVNDDNLGYAEALNIGIAASADAAFVVALNPDTEVPTGWLDRLRAPALADPDVVGVGPISGHAAGNQGAHLHLGMASADRPGLHHDLVAQRLPSEPLEVRVLMGFCMLMTRRGIDEVGVMDPDLFLGNDDLDWSWRVGLAGLKLVVTPNLYVHHVGQVSFGTRETSVTARLVAESTAVLARKLAVHYGLGNVPRPQSLWGVGFFDPPQEIYRPYALTLTAAPPWEPEPVLRILDAYQRTFGPHRPVVLHLLAEEAEQQVAVRVALEQLQSFGTRATEIAPVFVMPVPPGMLAPEAIRHSERLVARTSSETLVVSLETDRDALRVARELIEGVPAGV